MVSSSYADSARVERFMDDIYHRPTYRYGPGFDVSGAVDAVGVQVALVRWFANTKTFPARKQAVR